MAHSVNIRFPQEIKSKIEEKAEDEFRSQSSLVKEAVAQYFSDNDE